MKKERTQKKNYRGFSGSPVVETWPSNAGGMGLISGWEVAQMVKRLPTMQETRIQSLGREDPLEKEMTTHSSILAWKIPWTEEPGRLQSMESQRVGHDFFKAEEWNLSNLFVFLNKNAKQRSRKVFLKE